MKNTFWIAAVFTILLFFVSCKKKPVTEIDETFIGSWRHHFGENSYVDIYIQEDSKGEIERYEDGMTSGTFRLKWRIKNNKLYLGWLSFKKDAFEINQYPTIADTTIVHGFDSIPMGRKYIILNGEYYLD